MDKKKRELLQKKEVAPSRTLWLPFAVLSMLQAGYRANASTHVYSFAQTHTLSHT